jgi:hypothetical protein
MAPNTTAPEVDLSRLRSLLARPGLQSAWITVEELRALLDAVDQRSRLAVDLEALRALAAQGATLAGNAAAQLHELRQAAGALVEISDALGEQDCTAELISREAAAREHVRALLAVPHPVAERRVGGGPRGGR